MKIKSAILATVTLCFIALLMSNVFAVEGGIASNDVDSGINVRAGQVDQVDEPIQVDQDDGPTLADSSYFKGQGFALNSDESVGKIVKLMILISETGPLSGTFTIDGISYELEAYLSATGSKTNLDFIIFTKDSEKIGEFSGEIKNFKDFLLLRGKLKFKNKEYTLTAASSKETGIKIKDIAIAENAREEITTNMEERVTLRKIGEAETGAIAVEENEVSVKPIKITKKKIFGIIPNPWGRNVLEIEVVGEGKTIRKTITEGATETVKGYSITVGSLENQEEIELEVQQA